jgi:cell division septal protein FtsQ
MGPHGKKYIQNCTGDECRRERQPSPYARIISRLLFYILLLGFVGVLVYVLFFSQYLHLTDVRVSGTEELSNEQIVQAVMSSLEGKHLGIIPKNNFLFVTQGNIKKLLEGDFKMIRSVDASKTFPNTLAVTVEERKALLIWCQNAEHCFMIDEKGVAYSQADFNSPEILQNHLLKITDASSRDVKIGENILDDVIVEYVPQIKDALAGEGFETTGEYFMPSRVADEITVKTGQNVDVLLSTQIPLDKTIRTLGLVLKKQISHEQRGDLVYLDLRSENKVFYKFKDTQPQEGQQEGDGESKEDDDKKDKDDKKK